VSEIRFTVYGIAKPAGSKRGLLHPHTKRVMVIDAGGKDSREWKSEVKDAARAAYSGPPLEGPLQLIVKIYRPRLKSHLTKSGVPKLSGPTWCATRPDATKLLRGIEDAITNAGLWRDDAQVAHQTVVKSYDDPARVEITIRRLDP
jgi:Holliday junction resolvase RusA-like endonuclease